MPTVTDNNFIKKKLTLPDIINRSRCKNELKKVCKDILSDEVINTFYTGQTRNILY